MSLQSITIEASVRRKTSGVFMRYFREELTESELMEIISNHFNKEESESSFLDEFKIESIKL